MTVPLPPRAVVGQEALAALAVPARFAILNHLLDAGPRTASECAEVVGESPSNCSWHLRTLAKVGLVERGPDTDGDARRRPWQATAVGFDFRPDDGDSDVAPAAAVVAEAVEVNSLQYADALLRRYLAVRAALPAEWTGAAGGNSYSLAVTPDELGELVARLDAAIRPFVRSIRTAPPTEARLVHLSLRAFLNPDLAGAPRHSPPSRRRCV